jgi:hypothetical protein
MIVEESWYALLQGTSISRNSPGRIGENEKQPMHEATLETCVTGLETRWPKFSWTCSQIVKIGARKFVCYHSGF